MLASEQGFAFSPSTSEAGVECRRLHAVDLQPVLEDAGGSVDFDVPAVPAVSILGCTQGPDAVRWVVPGVVIEPFDGVIRGRAVAHIGDEVFVPFPSLAVRDAPAAVILPPGVIGVRASVLHGGPHVVFRVSPFHSNAITHSSGRCSVGDGLCPDGLEMQAPTGTGEPTREAISLHLSRFSAVAGAEPPRPAAPGRKPPGGREAAEDIARPHSACASAARRIPSQTRCEHLALQPANASAIPVGAPSSSRSRRKHRPVSKILIRQIERFRHRHTLHEKGAVWRILP